MRVMAADAGVALRHLSRHGFVVTGITSYAFMTAVELERGLPVVVEAPGFPRQGVVTGLAARSKLVFVCVVLLVTGDAGNAGVLEGRRFVAFLAFNLGVLAQQREAGQSMVDPGHLPVTLVVTGLAFVAFLALVFVVLFVAGDAGSLQFFL